MCVYAVRGYGMDMAAAWPCLPCALSEDAPTQIEHHSPPLYHPQPMQNLHAPGASCQLLGWPHEIHCEPVSTITFSYISDLGMDGRLSVHTCTHPVHDVSLSPFSLSVPSCRDTPYALERHSAKINECLSHPPQRKGSISILQQPNFPGKANFRK